MDKQLHLFRRGQTWYWRRRVPGFSTENITIQLSLRTQMRSEALILSRKLTAESDRMFDDLTLDLVTLDDARKWLAHIITDELKRIRRVSLVAQMDPTSSAEADERADWATATAWRLMAEFGPRASLEQKAIDRLAAAGATDADLVALKTTLAILAGDMRSEARMNRIAAGFERMTGQDRRQDSMALLSLLHLMIEGQASTAPPWRLCRILCPGVATPL